MTVLGLTHRERASNFIFAQGDRSVIGREDDVSLLG